MLTSADNRYPTVGVTTVRAALILSFAPGHSSHMELPVPAAVAEAHDAYKWFKDDRMKLNASQKKIFQHCFQQVLVFLEKRPASDNLLYN